ncbi:MAG: tetratricopeptide repeat protein [Acidobacteriota bacterium]
MNRPNRLAFVLVVLAMMAVLLGGCAPDRSNLDPIDHPDTAALEAPVGRQIEAARARVDRAMVRRDDTELAGALAALGDLYHVYGLVDPATTAYRNAAMLEPDAFGWRYALGLLTEAEGDFVAAQEHFTTALDLRPTDVPTRLHLGEIALALGDGATAQKAFDGAAADGNAEVAAIVAYGQGRTSLLVGDAANAVDAFRRVLELQPAAGSVRSALGNALRQLGEVEAAEAELAARASGEVVWSDPLAERLERLAISSGAFLDRGNGALVSGRFDDAVAELSRGVELHPEHVELRRDLGLARMRAGDLDGARSALREATELDPEDAQSWNDLGTVYKARGELDDAVTALERAITLQADHQQAHFNLANAHGAREDWAAVERHAARVLELEPDTPRARYLVAMAQSRRGETSTALATLRALVAAEPGELAYRQGLAAVLVEDRQLGAAIELATNAEALSDADAVTLLRAMAQAAWRQRQQTQAVELWRRVTELAPEEGQSWSELANGLQLTGRREDARRQFRKATEVDPQDAAPWLSEGPPPRA